MDRKEFIIKLYETGTLKFGEFVLKSGISSPFYINLRQIISHPELLEALARLSLEKFPEIKTFKLLAGVPYAGIPIASAISLRSGIGMIIPRKEEKSYGSKDSIIGTFSTGDQTLLIEDIITSGESILETKESLEMSGLFVKAAFVVIDRRPVESDFKKQNGVELLALFKIKEIISVLFEKGLLSSEVVEKVEQFLHDSNNLITPSEMASALNPLTTKLKSVIKEKQSNVVLSLDVTKSDEFFSILRKTAGYICMVKTHIDVLEDFSQLFIKELKIICRDSNILLFEDRKFADIGNTVRMQYRNGIYKISEWADFVTVHLIPGEAILDGLFEGLIGKSSFLLAKMSAKENLITENYTRNVINIGNKRKECVSGFIGHGNSVENIRRLRNKISQDLLLLIPGVQLGLKKDEIGQTYITPQMAIAGGADLIIVGRGITHSPEPREAAKLYRDVALESG